MALASSATRADDTTTVSGNGVAAGPADTSAMAAAPTTVAVPTLK